MHVEGKEQLVMNSAGEAGITGEKGLHLNTTGELFVSSGGASYLNAGGNMSIAGTLILLQGPATKAKTAKPVDFSGDILFVGKNKRAKSMNAIIDETLDRVLRLLQVGSKRTSMNCNVGLFISGSPNFLSQVRESFTTLSLGT